MLTEAERRPRKVSYIYGGINCIQCQKEIKEGRFT